MKNLFDPIRARGHSTARTFHGSEKPSSVTVEAEALFISMTDTTMPRVNSFDFAGRIERCRGSRSRLFLGMIHGCCPRQASGQPIPQKRSRRDDQTTTIRELLSATLFSAFRLTEKILRQAGRKGILLLNDDTSNLVALALVLRSHGCGVLESNDADEEIQVCPEHCGAVELLLIDFELGGSNAGPQLAERLLQFSREMSALFVVRAPLDKLLEAGTLPWAAPSCGSRSGRRPW